MPENAEKYERFFMLETVEIALAALDDKIQQSEDIIEKLNKVEKKFEKVNDIEKIIYERDCEISTLTEKVNVIERKLMEKELIITNLIDKVKAVENAMTRNEKIIPKKQNILDRLVELEKINTEKDERIKLLFINFDKLAKMRDDKQEDPLKCEKCEFVARNDVGLKVHVQAKHKVPTKVKCAMCNFTCESEELLKTHNDNPCS